MIRVSAAITLGRMVKFSTIVLLSMIGFEKTNGSDTRACSSAPDCPLFPNQNEGLVTLEALQQKVASKNWIMIYASDFTANQDNFGKCNCRWNARFSNNNVRREMMCYNPVTKVCDSYKRTVRRTLDNCNTAREDNVMNTTTDGVFDSQDINQYFWYDGCYGYNDAHQCTIRYLDLLVRKSRYPDSDGELDLQGLPWHLIAADVKNHFDMDFSDARMMFIWKGPECGLDGNVITSSGTRGGLNFIVLSIILMCACVF